MQITRQDDYISLRTNPLESQILGRVLRSVLKNYKIKPDEMDEKSARAWYSNRSQADMTTDEIAEWTAALHSFKTDQVQRLEQWLKKLTAQTDSFSELRLADADAAALIGVLNDHRLFVATSNDLQQEEMDVNSAKALKRLPAAKQNALCEIHFLAWVIEELIRAAAPEASRWMEDSR